MDSQWKIRPAYWFVNSWNRRWNIRNLRKRKNTFGHSKFNGRARSKCLTWTTMVSHPYFHKKTGVCWSVTAVVVWLALRCWKVAPKSDIYCWCWLLTQLFVVPIHNGHVICPNTIHMFNWHCIIVESVIDTNLIFEKYNKEEVGDWKGRMLKRIWYFQTIQIVLNLNNTADIINYNWNPNMIK